MENPIEAEATSSGISHINKEFLKFGPEPSIGDFQVADEVEERLSEIMEASRNNLAGAQIMRLQGVCLPLRAIGSATPQHVRYRG